jgi:hypothetical protein
MTFRTAVVRTWSCCGGSDPLKTALHGVSTLAEMPSNDREVGMVVETTTEPRTPPSRWAVKGAAQMASALQEAQGEAGKGL